VWLTLVVSSGVRSVQAAVTGGIGFFVVPKLLEMLFAWPGHYVTSHPETSGVTRSLLDFPNPSWGQAIAFILFGFGALTYAKHPEGIIEYQTSRSIAKTLARVDRFRGRTPSGDEGTEGTGGPDLTEHAGGPSGNGSSPAAPAAPTAPNLESARG
jgi:hypothetical protein